MLGNGKAAAQSICVWASGWLMLAVACAHLSIKDSQFDLKGNCALLLLHKEQQGSRAATKTGLRQRALPPKKKTLSIVQILVCKSAAARSSWGAQVRVATNPSWLHLINVDCSTCLLFQRERAATRLRYLCDFKSPQPVKPKNHVEDEGLFWLWRRGRPRFPTYFCICHLFYWQHNFATTDRVGACWDMPEPGISMKKKIHMKVGTRT